MKIPEVLISIYIRILGFLERMQFYGKTRSLCKRLSKRLPKMIFSLAMPHEDLSLSGNHFPQGPYDFSRVPFVTLEPANLSNTSNNHRVSLKYELIYNKIKSKTQRSIFFSIPHLMLGGIWGHHVNQWVKTSLTTPLPGLCTSGEILPYMTSLSVGKISPDVQRPGSGVVRLVLTHWLT